ncbi:hypothetical protein [Desertivirga xinjiangensis]|uniref:hypothetical protein n=1 Tax=Desertivirga xinjiangensis TaxID=539206 RepID=UPI00210A200F|nr:hypothetical protein [Pedobacter xinjiangensis]
MMHQKEIFKKIGAIIAELTEQYQYLSENPDQLNDLELELFAANSDFLAEHVKVLKKINLSAAPKQEDNQPKPTPAIAEQPKTAPVSRLAEQTEPLSVHVNEEPAEILSAASIPEPVQQQSIQQQPAQQQPAEESPVVQDPVHREPVQEEPVSEQQQPTRPLEKPQPEVHSISENKPANAEAPVNPVIETPEPVVREVVIPEKVASVEVPVQSEPAQQAAPTLNDIIFAQRMQGNTPEPQYNKQPITDLKSAINLNDKLLFIKDLFNGYSLAYSEAIELLNRFDSFSVAETFLKANYAVKNNWASKQSTVDKFYDILNRRYSK